MSRRRLPPGQRKELRDARLMTLIGLVFVVAGVWGITQGSVGLGVTAVLFFGACLLYGVLNWWSIHAERHEKADDAMTTVFGVAIVGISVLLGLGCLGAFILALVGWHEFSFATTVMFPRILVAVAGAVGAVLFIGGAIVMVVRKGRPFGVKPPDDQEPGDQD